MAPVLSKPYFNGTPMRTSSGSNQQPEGHARHQDSLKEQLELELRDAIFGITPVEGSATTAVEAVNWLLDAFYEPLDSKLSDRLPKLNSPDVTDLVKACLTKSEPSSYKHLAALFNRILKDLPKDVVKFRFYVYDKMMKERVDGSGSLKPDLLALSFLLTGDYRVFWRNVRVAVEVKASLSEGLKQAMTYARSMLAMEDKWFAPVLVVSHRSQKICGVFATRFGVFTTPALLLTQHDDFEAAAVLIARMCTAVGVRTNGLPAHLAGSDPSRAMGRDGNLSIALPASGGQAQWYKLSSIAHRISLLGRSTLVSVAEPIQPPSEDAAATPEAANAPASAIELLLEQEAAADEDRALRVPLPRRSDRLETSLSKTAAALRQVHRAADPLFGLTASTAQAAAAMLHPSSTSQPTQVSASDSIDGSPIRRWATYLRLAGGTASLDVPVGAKLIVKSSWQAFPRHDNEGQTLKKIKDLHGCPDSAGDMVVSHPLNRLAELILSGKFNVSSVINPIPEVDFDIGSILQMRVHTMVISKTPGVPLYSLVSQPTRFARALMDCMIGLFLAHKKGISHRDVTTGNLIGLEKARPQPNDVRANTLQALGPRFAREKLDGFLKDLHAFVNDFEHAIDWKDAYRERSFARSGTPEFMSVQQLLAFVEARIRAHSTIDDFESCVWVALYNVLLAYVDKHSEAEKEFFESFATDNYGQLLGQKFRMLQLRARDVEAKSALAETWALWERLFPVAYWAQNKLANLMAKYLATGAAGDKVSATSPHPTTHATSPSPSTDDASGPELFPGLPAESPLQRDDPENPFLTKPKDTDAQKKNVEKFHRELETLTETIFYRYMHALKKAMPFLPDVAQ
ncbi:hypothetical protein AURDEDRAFT_187289 [Auricularia subglabra TFB-10046 SS5]|uniref:Fungal-type protein kinase domain-containing protein n=1 Tax=Auricularia subglabra (strain TFB-10046 / SS5) TaxID=717982 RepID=J0WVT5_AURST|nr:hypothetical protein AURDEDRAFT_187289 [Auricularia subglabra TFB-10046 SS5]